MMNLIRITNALSLLLFTFLYWRETRRVSDARSEGYGDGWDDCEAHAKAHQTVCPEPDWEEAFDAGVKVGMGIAREDAMVDVECSCERCRVERFAIN